MVKLEPGDTDKRNFGRRKEDFVLRDQNQRFKQLYTVGQAITSEMKMEPLFDLIMDQTNEIMNTERSTVFLYDDENAELWSLVATGMGSDKIRIDCKSGVAGWVFQNCEPVIINDTYQDARFNLEVDKKTGFVTRNLLCVPVVNRKNQCIGVLQSLNIHSGQFTEDDAEFLGSISDYVAIAVENARLYEDVKSYSEKLENAIIKNETLEKAKSQLTKFVPVSVARMVDQDPDGLNAEKVPMEVSVLFLDIQGFSGITEKYDPLQVNDMVENHFSRYLDCVQLHGGELNETSGDGLMVIFKSDTIEQHAVEAVAAGLAIVGENERMNQDIAYPWGGVSLHMGIESGEAYVGATHMKSVTGDRWTYTASGMVTVMAARIGALSDHSRLFVGPGTMDRISANFSCESLGEHLLKNVSGRTPVYEVKPILTINT